MTKIPVLKKTINEVSFSSVTVGTNGYHGGDAGHGSKTYIELNSPDADMCFSVKNGGRNFQVEAVGDAELRTLIKAFKFIVQTLENQVEPQGEPYDSSKSFYTPEPNSYLAKYCNG